MLSRENYFVAEYEREIFAQFSKSEFVNQSILGADVVVVNGRVEEEVSWEL